MLSVFKLAEAMNEAATGRFRDNIAPYEFIGSLEESTSEMNFILLSEQASINSFYVGAEEIMTEAAINNPGTLDVLCENVFTNMIGKLKQLIDKIIAAVKGIIAKLKAYFYQLTGKTDKWVSIMEPRVNAAKTGAENAKVNRYNWDTDFVIADMPKGFLGHITESDSKILADIGATKNEMKAIKDTMTKHQKDEMFTGEMQAGKNDTIDSAKYKEKIGKDSKYQDMIDNIEKKTEKLADTTRSEFAGKLRVNAGSSDEEFWNNVTKKATGGEKIDMTIKDLGGAKTIMDRIKKSKDAISDIQKAYDAHIKALQKARADVEDFEKTDIVEKADKFPGEYVAAYKTFVSKQCAYFSKVFTMKETYLTNARGKNVSWLKQLNSDDMAAINAYCSYKGEKK